MRELLPGVLRATAAALLINVCAAATPVPLDTAPVDWDIYRKLWVPGIEPAKATEPIRATYDAAAALTFLDDVAVKWARHNECGTCHTTVSYLVATSADGDGPHASAVAEVRETMLRYALTHLEKPDPFTLFHVPPEASALAIQDGRSGVKPDPRVRELFRQVWQLQDQDGSWHYPTEDGFLPFLERDRTYIALLVALAAGYSPDEVLVSPGATAGLDRLRHYIRNNQPDSIHHQAVLLWASVRTRGLLDESEQSRYQQAILRLQKPDGGWALPSLGTWLRHDGAPNDPKGESDGYATGLAALVLCESGKSGSPAVARALGWLKHNQRNSGRWYTRSLYSDKFKGYLSNMGTAYALLALETCQS